MDAFRVLTEILDDYQAFVQGFLNIRDEQIRATVDAEIENGLLWPEPWLALNPSFEPGGRIGELVGDETLHPACLDIFRHRTVDDPGGREINLHRHQREAIDIARRGESYVLTTGTGSGKSLAYIIPIVDRVLRDGSGRGVQAIIVYPMNALANSQIGELEKFLGKERPSVTFARYTGQENTRERDRILTEKPDILLTNYVMLELMLVRPQERERLISSAENLRFLVLDELHTYRGRQGADVAMLVRRLREAVGARPLQCVGTSATLAGPGTRQQQREEVAALATRLFGQDIIAENVIGETLRRATKGTADVAQLRERLTSSTAPDGYEGLRRDQLAIWIEQTFGLRVGDEGGLVRQTPTRMANAVARLTEETGVGPVAAEQALRDTFLSGSNVRDDEDRTLFAFKLHQFIGKGDTAYVTLEPPARRYITTQYQRSAPNRPTGQPLYPLAFCRECGQEYLVVNREKRDDGIVYTPRRLTGTPGDPVDAEGLLYLTEQAWPADGDTKLLDAIPEDWIIDDGVQRALDPSRRPRLPLPVVLDTFGVQAEGGTPAAFFERLHFCPSCRTTYESARQSEFSRVASLGTEGRASAVTVLSQAVVRSLRAIDGLADEARKFLAFSDNRQDASLQAGHFNDFVLVGLVRSALYRALRDRQQTNPDEPISDDQLGPAVVAALGIDMEHYAQNPHAEFGARKRIQQALRESIAYRVYADLKRGWRITMPNLEQTGLLVLDYDSLEEMAAAHEKWDGTHPALATADPTTRVAIVRVLLHELRRNLCVESEYLQEDRYEAIRRASQEWLKAPWSLTDQQGIYAATCYAGPRGRGRTNRGDLYLSGLGQFGRWLRRHDRFPNHRGSLRVADADVLIVDLLTVLARLGMLATIREDASTGYRVHAGMLLWNAGSGEQRAIDPLRGSSMGRVNPYFRRFYQATASELAGLEAREHTAQVKPEDRREREHLFGDAKLPVLYCSPTMELGVDIKDLNVVGMRNVPPTPANYAQRSGRAGRSGQPAVVLTYCATGSAHDNYYFVRSQEMVGGAIAPPRLELGNQDLVRAHAHAIWLVETNLDLKAKMTEVLDAEVEDLPLHPDVDSKIRSAAAGRRARASIAKVLHATSEVTSAAWWRDDWIDRTVADAPHAFERSLERWRGLYRDAHAELDAANAALKKINADETTKARARGQIAEARGALDLLRGDVDDVNQGDFYTYRYFASEGFLPGYSFPRLPLAAFIPGERKTKSGQGDYVQRPRFLAISEFGPGAFIYHEGARYEVVKVTLPAREDGTGVHLTETKRCADCGYLNEGNGETGREVCEYCSSASLIRIDKLMRLLAVKTRRRDRINADEEERQRAGYDILTTLRFEPHGERSSQQSSRLRDDSRVELAHLTYGDTALIRRMNVGLRRRKNKNEVGYLLNTIDGRWARAADVPIVGDRDGDASTPPDDRDDPDARIRRVVPYVEDHRNALLVRLPDESSVEERMAVMYALKRGIEAVFQLEDNELAAEPLPGRTGARPWAVMLFYEAAEGGAGVLRRLASEHGQFNRVARRALALLHFDPETGEDQGKAVHAAERCAQACYDCLLSYGNQWDHQRLDRHCARDILLRLRDAALDIGGPAGEDRTSEVARLTAASNSLEARLVSLLDEGGYLLPTEAQQKVDGLWVQPDFAYRRADVDAAIFVDGPIHDFARQAEKDERARKKLEREGWLVLRFHHEERRTAECGDHPTWQEIIDANSHLFGTGKRSAT